jgi:hypothetical protein
VKQLALTDQLTHPFGVRAEAIEMKKGSLADLGLLIVFAVVLVFSFFIISNMYSSFKTSYIQSVNDSGMYDSTQEKIMASGTKVTDTFINMTPFVILFIGIGAIILAFMIPVHPVFMPLSVFVLAVYIFLAAIFSNVLYAFITSDTMLPITNSHYIIAQLTTWLPHIIAIIGAVLIIVMYGQRGMAQA